MIKPYVLLMLGIAASLAFVAIAGGRSASRADRRLLAIAACVAAAVGATLEFAP